eukprot:9179596-Pyramimonas_sp.AAC.1
MNYWTTGESNSRCGPSVGQTHERVLGGGRSGAVGAREDAAKQIAGGRPCSCSGQPSTTEGPGPSEGQKTPRSKSWAMLGTSLHDRGPERGQ